MINDIVHPLIIAMLSDIETVFKKHDVQYYIVGALARDIHLSVHESYTAPRKTNDVDLAIMLDSEEQFYKVMEELINSENFTEVKGNPIKLYYKQSLEIDLLPFGEIESEYSEIRINKPKLFAIDVPGFKELQNFVQNVEASGKVLSVCPLEGIIILKLIAYHDNQTRDKDLADITHLIQVYFDLNTNEIFDGHYDVLLMYDADNKDYLQLVSQRVIGRKIKLLLSDYPDLLKKVQDSMIVGSPAIVLWQEMYEGMLDE